MISGGYGWWRIVTLLWLCASLLTNDFAGGEIPSTEEFSFNVSVALTTIPPRFSSVHHSIRSWLNQDHLPRHVFVFVPPHYRRFKRKSGHHRSSTDDLEKQLKEHLSEHTDIKPFVDSGLIRIVSVERDMGPITRIAGILSVVSKLPVNHTDYWLICDDDVSYDPTVLATYRLKMNQLRDSLTPHDRRERIGLTLFAETYRLVIPMDALMTNMAMIPHIQGVDTYLFGHQLLIEEAHTAGPLSRNSFDSILHMIHNECPTSFYQDDYIASVLFHLAKVHFMSIWENNRKLVHHVDGVSTSHFQMHLDPRVFEREHQTKQCLSTIVPRIVQFLQPETARSPREDGL